MTAKPNRPVLYFLPPLVLLYFMVTLLGIVKWGILAFLIAIIMGFFLWFSLKIINDFKIFELNDTLVIKGYLWGKREIELKDIKGYQTREVRRRGITFPETDIVIFDKEAKEICRLICFDYEEKVVNMFKEKLFENNVEYLGHESLKHQVQRQIERIKSSLGLK
jgi:hypothetical protein